jgi:hypothetical protein
MIDIVSNKAVEEAGTKIEIYVYWQVFIQDVVDIS